MPILLIFAFHPLGIRPCPLVGLLSAISATTCSSTFSSVFLLCFYQTKGSNNGEFAKPDEYPTQTQVDRVVGIQKVSPSSFVCQNILIHLVPVLTCPTSIAAISDTFACRTWRESPPSLPSRRVLRPLTPTRPLASSWARRLSVFLYLPSPGCTTHFVSITSLT